MDQLQYPPGYVELDDDPDRPELISVDDNVSNSFDIPGQSSQAVFGYSENQEYLETLLVKLTQSAKNILLDGLPLNAVPITRMTSTIPVTFQNGDVRSVSHIQVQVILNFSMTDYNSHGRT
ncbi:hypothetical protein C8J56DRAFT_891708 [Mycena floridula]|nr:hypothetical protein C8J56DRAFT_891708 [Mycena floridula]